MGKNNKAWEKLKASIDIKEDTQWLNKAKWRRDNTDWLDYDFQVALKIIRSMREQGMEKETLATKSGLSNDRIKTIIKGSSDPKLSELVRIQNVLGIELISKPYGNNG